MSKIDWDEVKWKLPYEQTDEAKKKRRRLFSDFDPNGNGYLSLAEVSSEETETQVRWYIGLFVGRERNSGCAEMRGDLQLQTGHSQGLPLRQGQVQSGQRVWTELHRAHGVQAVSEDLAAVLRVLPGLWHVRKPLSNCKTLESLDSFFKCNFQDWHGQWPPHFEGRVHLGENQADHRKVGGENRRLG